MWDMIGGMFSAGANIYGGMEQRAQQEELFNRQQAFNVAAGVNTMNYNSAEAEKARTFSAQQADSARQFNSDETVKARMYDWGKFKEAEDFNDRQAEIARGYNTSEAQAARQFQEKMSSTAYQRAMQDMRSAGLNPILAYQQGGANTPSGGMASSGGASVSGGGSPQASGPAAAAGGAAHFGGTSSPNAPQVQNMFQNSASSALEVMRTMPQIKNMEQTNRNLHEEEFRIAAEADRATADKLVKNAQEENVKAQTQALQRQATTGPIDKEFYGSKVGEWSRYIGNIMREVSPFVSNAKTLNQMVNPQ